MKNKICSLIKYEWKFKIVHFSIMIITLLIAITMFRYNDYTLQLPGKNLFMFSYSFMYNVLYC